MRHRIKIGKVGSFTPEKQNVEVEQQEDIEVTEDEGCGTAFLNTREELNGLFHIRLL